MSFHMSSIKHWTFLAYKLYALYFSFMFLLYQYSYALTHTHVSNCRSISTLDPADNNPSISSYDFESPINQAEDGGAKISLNFPKKVIMMA